MIRLEDGGKPSLPEKGDDMYSTRRMLHTLFLLLIGLAIPVLSYDCCFAEVRLSRGQALYVPTYSHVYIGDRAAPFNLAATLSVRNADMSNPITVVSVDYYDSNGKLVRRMVQKPFSLKPLASSSFFIKERDTSGGFGASFIVRWRADREVNAPVVESLMIGTYSGQGISFTGSALEIR